MRSVMMVSVAVLGWGQLSASQLAAQTSHMAVDYLPSVEYEGGKDLLDIYMPENAIDVPVVVFFHGGGLVEGDRNVGAGVARRLTPLGIGVVSPSYRLTPSVSHPSHIEDAAAATAWVLEHIEAYGGDPDKVYVSGHSAGAYLAALLGVDPSWLHAAGGSKEAVQGFIPISAFLYVEETAPDRPSEVWGADPAGWVEASVSPHIRSARARMLLIYADGDAEWRREQNERFGAEVAEVGLSSVQVIEVPDRDHRSLITAINAGDDRIGTLIAEFVAAR